MRKQKKDTGTGRLKIGDNWNAITIIALSQTNPLKAIAEFAENSIDAKARNIQIIKGKHRGEHYLRVIDDGEGIDDFKYVATHIADSIKKRLKSEGIAGIQGEFGIGLLSFWTVGEELVLTSTGKEGITRRMRLVKNNPGYSIAPVNALFGNRGSELLIQPILPGIRQLNGEKIQNYLASELRDRISKSGVNISIIDRTARKQLTVRPRQFTGRLLHNLPEIKSPIGDIYCELYLSEPKPEHAVGLYRFGTRVLPSIASLDRFNASPWTSGYIEGIIDVSFLQLTPGTRDGIIFDASYDSFCESMAEVTALLSEIVSEQEKTEEEKTSRNIMQKVKKALREAFLILPREEYNWLDIHTGDRATQGDGTGSSRDSEPASGHRPEPATAAGGATSEAIAKTAEKAAQKAFFEYPGPLYGLLMSPSSAIMGVSEKKKFRAIARDRNKRQINSGVDTKWKIKEGSGTLDPPEGEIVEFTAPDEPGISIIEATAFQDDATAAAESVITVTDQLMPKKDSSAGLMNKKGLPGYTYRKAPGELWRSRFDLEKYVIVINNGHADFIFASKNNTRKLKYILRLYSKELILGNFPELSKEELLERMIELTLYTEEHIR
ncbi:MAG: hypothetical protein A2W19_07980 [Spirochaetes bacterium RBG_16_49_21]|nr:MAG: hypothetical protein A2W19_07980 [Spirochaetes bacterium RBG_16_49_21]